MAHNTQLDALDLADLNLGYDKIKRDLSEEPRLIGGTNCAVTSGGKLIKRWGTKLAAAGSTPVTGKRIDRLWLYENLTGVVYLLSSQYDTSSTNWAMYYSTLSGAISWTSFGTLRSINASTAAHEGVVSRGIFYCKGFPTSGSGEKLGTVQFDTNSGSVVVTTWGLLGPTTPARIVGTTMRLTAAITASSTTIAVTSHTVPTVPYDLYIEYEIVHVTADTGTSLTATRAAQGTLASPHANNVLAVFKGTPGGAAWSTSGHPVTVNFGWQYVYAYQSLSNQVSNRSPLETNPDNNPSSTGPFINLIPQVTVQGIADTTNIPKIVIFRSTDGGGTFFQLDTITNTGAGAIVYSDNQLASGSGSTFTDPQPDASLGSGTIGPTLTSNGPPPTVVAPLVVGTDTPALSSPLEVFQGRIWYGLSNILFYSAQEELSTGVPEESFPSGSRGNFIRFPHPILNVKSTTYALYIITNAAVYQLTGSTRETFSVRPVLTNLGGAFGHPRAIDRYGDAIVWLTSDYRIAILQGRLTVYGQDYFKAISDPLYTDLVNLANSGGANVEFDIKYWADLDKEYIIVAGHHKTTPSSSQQWVYDILKSQSNIQGSSGTIKKEFWFVPWSINTSAMASGRISATSFQRRLIFNVHDTSHNNSIVMLDPVGNTATDINAAGTATKYAANFTTNLFQTPLGNHINERRRPGMASVNYEFRLDRTTFSLDDDPTISYYKDDLFTDPAVLSQAPEDPSRRDLSKGYKTCIYPINEICQRIGFLVDFGSTRTQAEIQNLALIWLPDSGA